MPDNFKEPTLRERMQQAALLPGHDPVRAKVMQEIAAAQTPDAIVDDVEGPAGREWLELSEETERLKLALLSTPVPAGLEARLLAIPDETSQPLPWWNRPLPNLFTLRRLAVAAGLMLLIVAGWLAYVGVRNWQQRRTMEHVAALATDIHKAVSAHPPAEQIATSDPKQAKEWLQKRMNFPAIMLSAPNTKLTAAGVVRLGEATAALTRWEKEGHTYTLLEFVPASVGLSSDFPQQSTEDSSPGPAGVPSKTILWSEPHQGCGWALVMDNTASNTFTY